VDPLEVYETTKSLTERLRAGEGPAFMHLHGGLLDPPPSSRDTRRYRTREEIEETARTKDPVKRLREILLERGLASEDEVERMRDEIKARVDAAEEEVITQSEVSA